MPKNNKEPKNVMALTRPQLIDELIGTVHPDHIHHTIVGLNTASLRALVVYYQSKLDDRHDGRKSGISLLADHYTQKIGY